MQNYFSFTPQKILFIKDNQIEFQYLAMVDDEIETDFKAICNIALTPQSTHLSEKKIEIKSRISKKDYHQKVDKILRTHS